MDSANLALYEQNNTGAVNSTPVVNNGLYEENINADGVSESVQEEKKPYEFRKLKSGDLFPMIKIISKIGLNELSAVLDKNTMQELVNQAKKESENNGDALAYLVGVDVITKVVNKVLEHLPDCQKEIYTLLSNTSNLSVQELEELELAVFIEMVFDFVKMDGFKDFFKAASKCLQVLG